MNSLFKLLVGLASITTVWGSAIRFDSHVVDGLPYDLSNRYLAGEFDDHIMRHYTSVDGYVDEAGVVKNHDALRHHARCALMPDRCTAPSY